MADGKKSKVRHLSGKGRTKPQDSDVNVTIDPKGVDSADNDGGGQPEGVSIGSRLTAPFRWFGGKVTRTTSTIVTKISDFFYLPKPVVGGALVLIFALVTGGSAFGVGSYLYEQQMMKYEYAPDPCDDMKKEVKKQQGNAEIGDATDKEANIKKIASVLKAIGCNDEQVAGALGNIQQECDFAPDCVEGDSGTNFHPEQKYDKSIGRPGETIDLKMSKLNGYASSKGYRGFYAETSNHQPLPGCGYPQFTGPECENMLHWFDQVGKKDGKPVDWFNLTDGGDYQLAYMISSYGENCELGGVPETVAWESNSTSKGWRAGWLVRWAHEPVLTDEPPEGTKYNEYGSPEAAMYAFLYHYERDTNVGSYQPENRIKYANELFPKVKNGDYYDDAYGQSIVQLAQQLANSNVQQAKKKVDDECGEKDERPESVEGDLAAAAVAYAYSTRDQGKGNNGTALYQQVRQMVGNDGIYMSCDRGVSTAVKWSGADYNIPNGNAAAIYDYLQGHPDKWQDLGRYDNSKFSTLQPGDILSKKASGGGRSGHILMFTGEELNKSYHSGAEAKSCTVSASYGTRSPGCGPPAAISNPNAGTGYHIFRLKQYESDRTKYTSQVAIPSPPVSW